MQVDGKKVVIVGGGISGLWLAKKLHGKAGREVTVVCDKPFYEHSIDGTYSLTQPAGYLRSLSTKNKHHEGWKVVTATATELQETHVVLNNGTSLAYDVCVLAVGYGYPVVKPGVGQPLSERMQEVNDWSTKLKNAKSILVSGGGAIAVELACDARAINSGANITIVTRDPACLSMVTERYQQKAAEVLASKKIDVISNDEVDERSPVHETSPRSFALKSGKTVDADVFIPCFSTGGLAGWSGLANQKGWVDTDEHLRAKGNPRVFALGCNGEPSTVINIEHQMKTLLFNIETALKGTDAALKVHTPLPAGAPGAFKMGPDFAMFYPP